MQRRPQNRTPRAYHANTAADNSSADTPSASSHHKDVPLLPPPPDPSPAADLATATSPDATAPSSQVPLRRSTRLSRPPDRYGFNHTSLLTTLSSIAILNSYSQVVKHGCWKKTMQEELAALQSNHTWDIVPCLFFFKTHWLQMGFLSQT